MGILNCAWLPLNSSRSHHSLYSRCCFREDHSALLGSRITDSTPVAGDESQRDWDSALLEVREEMKFISWIHGGRLHPCGRWRKSGGISELKPVAVGRRGNKILRRTETSHSSSKTWMPPQRMWLRVSSRDPPSPPVMTR